MKKSFKAIAKISIVAASLLALGSCVANEDSSGLEYMPDMYRSPAIEPYVDYAEIRGRERTELKMQVSAKTPPFGTIPYRGTDTAYVNLMMPYKRLPEPAFKETHGLFGWAYAADQYNQAANDKNPLTLTAANSKMILDKGKQLYAANCAHCHGDKGDGQGTMVQSGAYTGVPNYKDRMNLGDGQIFYSIYYGKGMMGAHGPILNKEEIWTLVHYVRQFQYDDYGKFNEDGTPASSADADDAATMSDSTKG